MSKSMNDMDLAAPWIPDTQRIVQSKLKVQEKVEWGKRIFDVLMASLGLLLVSPLVLVIAIMIKIEDPRGTVFFGQIRFGKDGRLFKIYKFRSMVTNAEEQLEQLLDHNEVSGAMFKMKEDPRVTKVGRLIRKTSIDELPQLWNVIRGDMSIVGPRPPVQREVLMYNDHDFQRLLVLPGCTGLWQVSGRNSLGFEEMVKLDLQYIAKRSPWLDLYIILKTVWSIFVSRNAF